MAAGLVPIRSAPDDGRRFELDLRWGRSDRGQRDGESGASAKFALGSDRATVAFDDATADGKSDAGPFICLAAVEALERHKDLFRMADPRSRCRYR